MSQGSKASAATPTTASSSGAPSSSSSSSHLHGEDRLAKTWRTLANCFIVGSQKAEKVVAGNDPNNSSNQKEMQVAMKELDDYVVLFLRTRVEWGRLISYLEAKIEGTAAEMETMQHFSRTMSTMGSSHPGKKRKLAEDISGEAASLGGESSSSKRTNMTTPTPPPSAPAV
uniref:Uncharacterized protein n=1 Tax=Entomoneis paludosa TaxID=265537 RepID=A0A7S2YAE8_9STRA|mmetsp:Transcript_24810/g.51576  ORF Transcript_24810/g.51576 Transcript_24810/m.51576 type:complete len:171 (+) Transcript_24810:98-610(+)